LNLYPPNLANISSQHILQICPMQTVVRFLFRALLLAFGLVFAASLAVAFVVLLGVWGARSVWARLTGKTVQPFVMRVNPREGFGQVFRAGQSGQRRTPGQPRAMSDVTDVQVKETRQP
jgi:flagellar biosynthesis protein FlhB